MHYPSPDTVIKWLMINIPDLTPALSTQKTIQLWLQGNTKIFITFIQMIGIVPGLISVQWPESFTTYFLNIFSVMSFDIQGLFLLGCVVNTSSFYYAFSFSLCLPLILLSCTVGSFYCQLKSLKPTPNDDGDGQQRAQLEGSHLHALFFGLHIIWPGVTSDMLRLFHCTKIYNTWHLSEDLSIVCFEGSWSVAAVLGALGLLIYAVGIPLVFLRLIHMSKAPSAPHFLILSLYYDATCSCITHHY